MYGIYTPEKVACIKNHEPLGMLNIMLLFLLASNVLDVIQVGFSEMQNLTF